MPRRVLIVPDKFKGTLTAQAAAEAIGRGWRMVHPGDELQRLPMSDGGDGFGEVMAALMPAEPRGISTFNAAQQPCESTWWWSADQRNALIESARIIGLALLPPKKFHPFELDTSGLGPVFEAAATYEAEECLVGIGGSATNDGGFGLAKSLGWKFVAEGSAEITRWTHLERLARIIPPSAPFHLPEVIVAVDVQNPLLGPLGASRVYGPQKGLTPEDFPQAEACLGRLADVVKEQLGLDVANEPGTGAAGGLGFGLRSFLNARLQSGFTLFANYARLEERIRTSDLVLTGEGSIDDSTLMGKGVGEIARLCQKHGVPCIGLGGNVSISEPQLDRQQLFTATFGIVPTLAQPAEAMLKAELLLTQLAQRVGHHWA